MKIRRADRLIIAFFIICAAFIVCPGVAIVKAEPAASLAPLENSQRQRDYVAFPDSDEVEIISGANLFGRYETASAQKNNRPYKVGEEGINADVLNNAPESRLSAKITGLLFSENKAKSLVIIDYGGKQSSYVAGERITGSNAVILLIQQERVLLDENGYYTRLFFQQ